MSTNNNNAVNDKPKAFLGIGWKFPIAVGQDLQIQMSSYEENIRESILIILETKKGERVMRPDFGCGIHDFVYESINSLTLGQMKLSISDALSKYEPRIELINLEISINDVDNGILNINIVYRVISTNNRFNLVYPFYIREG